jgi:hypothetical protein
MNTASMTPFGLGMLAYFEGETEAIAQRCGHVLDIGEGTGFHSLVLEYAAVSVTAIHFMHPMS